MEPVITMSPRNGLKMSAGRNVAFAAALVLAGVSATRADDGAVAPPQGAMLALEVVADGVQIYACEAKGSSFEWVFKSPEANLFDRSGRQVGTHFAGPSWKTEDGTSIVGEIVAKQDAPEKGAIPWLLLRAKSHEGTGPLAETAFIRRADTRGGAAPGSGCDPAHNGTQARMRYSATYQFFTAAK